MIKKNNLFKELIILIFFIFFTAWYFKPLLLHFSSSLPDNYDGLFITWSINRMAQNLPSLPGELLTGNIFYPHPYSHAYSDPFLTAGLIAQPFLKINPEPLIAFNINLLLGQILTLYFTYLFLVQLIKDRVTSFVLSLVFSFSLIHLHYIPHLHTFSIQLLPLAGFCLLKLGETKKAFWLYVWAGTFIFQALNSFLPGYFILFLSTGLYFFNSDLKKAIKKNLKHLIITSLIIFIALFPILNIYLKVSKHFNYVRPITEVIHFSLSPEEIITKFFSPILYLLFAISLIHFLQQKKKNKSSAFYLLLSTLCFIISLGPALHWMRKTIKIPFHILPAGRQVPLPYIFLYFFAPGFKGFRTPSRWVLMMALTMTAFSSIELKNILKKIKVPALILILLLFLITLPQCKHYVSIPQIKEYPPVYSWLKNQDKKVIIELPINTWGKTEENKQEVYRMLYSLLHQKTLVNGYSGYIPEEYNQLVALLRNNFPSQEAIDKLKSMNVDLIILHQDEYAKIWQEKTREKKEQLDVLRGIKLIKTINQDLVYEL